jgi:hypothetical protein
MQVRYMNYAGCKRKFDVDAYVRKLAKYMPEQGDKVLHQAAGSIDEIGDRDRTYRCHCAETGGARCAQEEEGEGKTA